MILGHQRGQVLGLPHPIASAEGDIGAEIGEVVGRRLGEGLGRPTSSATAPVAQALDNTLVPALLPGESRRSCAVRFNEQIDKDGG